MFNFAELRISKDLILSKISEEDIFERYLGIRPEYGRQFCNPLRDDKTPGCNFNTRNGKIVFYDPGRHYQWDCFNVVEFLFKCTFKEALNTIAVDFGIFGGTASNIRTAREQRKKDVVGIRIQRRDINQYDRVYWQDRFYQTDEDLKATSIFPVSQAWFERNGILESFYNYRPNDPCYAYHFGGYDYKLYMPYRDKGRRFYQTRGDIIQGINLLPPKGHIGIVTKSYKDVVCIRKFKAEFDIHAIAPMSETQIIPAGIYEDFKSRFDYVFSLFDFDRAGIKLMRKYEAAYRLPPLMFGREFKRQGIKDFANHLEIKRYDETKLLLTNLYGNIIG